MELISKEISTKLSAKMQQIWSEEFAVGNDRNKRWTGNDHVNFFSETREISNNE
jgi:hypothetical protein